MNTIGEEAFFYCYFAGIIFIVMYAVIALPMLLTVPKRGVKAYFRGIIRLLLFLTLLFAYGAVGNAVWVALFNNRLYVSADPLTYFIPVVPFGWWAIDAPCGGKLLGNVRMWELQALCTSSGVTSRHSTNE